MENTTKEARIEDGLIIKLQDLKYTYRKDIRTQKSLENNFREKFNALNKVNLSNAEFSKLLSEIVSTDTFKSAETLRTTNTFMRDDATPLQYSLVNLKDWCKNDFEVINQLNINTTKSNHRYDVILLINGLPLVQIELKSLQISPRLAMEQIVKYKNDKGNGYQNTLLCFMQLFIASNREQTYYFANNQNKHFNFNAEERFLPIYQLAKENNDKINFLDEFVGKFLAKCTLSEMISKYMVLVASEQKIMIMRPYQIYAVKSIVDCIKQNRGNGYIWHTTGSGKTLTSFKTSTLLKDNPNIDKCLFIVDRKDLDRQTREEFNKFQEGCVEANTNTQTLVDRMLSEDYSDKVIVSTIQKLGLALDETNKINKTLKKYKQNSYKKQLQTLKDKRIVFIFDECHRSQFGENHKAIKEFFPNAQLFGFTGTPIFDKNSSSSQREDEQLFKLTTKDIFQKELHKYTITNAIDDGNVLRFQIDYFGEKPKNDDENKKIKTNSLTPEKIITEILEKHNQITDNRRFNAILATSSINSAIDYFRAFKKLQAEKQANNPDFKKLNIACVFSPPPSVSKEARQIQEDLSQEKQDNLENVEQKKAALKEILTDYNQQYSTNHRTSEFDLYYQDIQSRIKDQQYSNADYPQKNKIDITIVVDMLLTGFDSKYLNTLYVDKNLKHHGLIQAFSRTNRVLNDTKPHGKILDFRYQEVQVNEAIEMFSGSEKQNSKQIWLVDSAPIVIEKLADATKELEIFMHSQGLEFTPSEALNLKGDKSKVEFIKKFKEVQRLKNQLDQYTELEEEQKQQINDIISIDDSRSFKSVYLETAKRLKEVQNNNTSDENIIDNVDFELVLFSSSLIDYDYIMQLIANSTGDATGETTIEKTTKEQLIIALSSASNLMDEKDGIIDYINSLPMGEVLDENTVKQGYTNFKEQQSNKELKQIAKNHNLNYEKLQNFTQQTLDFMSFDSGKFANILKDKNLGWKQRATFEKNLMNELMPYLKKLAGDNQISGIGVYE
jgi:type I restriction enzyme R subunit